MAERSRRLPVGVEFPEHATWPVTLRAGAVVLRPLRRRDVGRWERLRERNRAWTGPWDATAPELDRPAGPAPVSSLAQNVKVLNRKGASGQALPFAVCYDTAWPKRETKPSRLPMGGQVTVNNIVYGSARFASIGYWIDESLAGRGVMPTAVALVADYCFQVLQLHRLEVNIRPENTKNLRVVEKLGLRDEGLRPRFLHIDGDWRDHRCFVAVDEEVPEGLLNRLEARRAAGLGG